MTKRTLKDNPRLPLDLAIQAVDKVVQTAYLIGTHLEQSDILDKIDEKSLVPAYMSMATVQPFSRNKVFINTITLSVIESWFEDGVLERMRGASGMYLSDIVINTPRKHREGVLRFIFNSAGLRNRPIYNAKKQHLSHFNSIVRLLIGREGITSRVLDDYVSQCARSERTKEERLAIYHVGEMLLLENERGNIFLEIAEELMIHMVMRRIEYTYSDRYQYTGQNDLEHSFYDSLTVGA